MSTPEAEHYRLVELPYQADPLPRLRLVRDLGHSVLLDSAAGIERFARYSILAAGPQALIEPRANETGLQTLARLRDALSHFPAARWPEHVSLPFGAGALGYLSYDFGRLLETLPALADADVRLPSLKMGIYLWSIVNDRSRQQSWLVCHPALPEAEQQALLTRLQEQSSAPRPFALTAPFQPEQTRADYQASFERVQNYIHAGDCYQINLSQRFSASCSGDPLSAYQRLRKACPVPFAAYIESDGYSLLCLSPERFLSVSQGEVETRPIKGTRARGTTAQQDAQLAADLQTSLKDRAENLMIVDLLRNDLSRSCAAGSVKVPELFKLESYPNVHHLVSSVTGRLAEGRDALDLLAGAFPGGSITGAPKIRAMQIIEELEPVRRSLYCGSIGYIGCEGQMDLNIAIRSLVHQDERLYCWGGGGIVADSEGESEYQETLAKVRVLMDALAG
ncbi:aminodeoxychorismate synthase component I [Halopseudomonas laoshanensis]|jgi:para-aminobenzoate synthetase component 1|uniref:aminodeoxychorismate synthase component I n=1 Tax=Halopseudomonas TaxID=2901189 RepID=UPI003735F548